MKVFEPHLAASGLDWHAGGMESGETRRKWRQRIEAQEAGGLTVTEYCQREGVNRVSMFQWRRKLGYTGSAPAPAEAVPRRRGEAARAHWAALIGEQAASGESVTAWCAAAPPPFSRATSTCFRHRIDPQRYFTQLLLNLPDANAEELEGWLPDRWLSRQGVDLPTEIARA